MCFVPSISPQATTGHGAPAATAAVLSSTAPLPHGPADTPAPTVQNPLAPAAANPSQTPAGASSGYMVHDGHVHLTNYIQEGPDIRDFLKVMGDKVGRVVLFGLPLQQMWSYTNTGDYAPTYYLQTDAPLFAKLTPEVSEKVRKGNCARLFDEARRWVRAWEKANLK